MSRISKFIERELDMVNEYLGMAKARLAVVTELCENNCEQITNSLDSEETEIINYINNKLYNLDSKISSAKDGIYQFKDFCFNLETIKKH